MNETEWAKSVIAEKKLGKSPYETLRRIARYYIDSGQSKAETRSSVEEYVVACDSSASIVKWSKTIDAAVTYAAKHPAVNIDFIPVTEPEMRTINALDSGRQAQRLAFTLLCLSKYWNRCNDSSSYWVNSRDTDIMQMANIKTSVKRQCKLYHDLKERGLISFSHKIDCNHVRVNFASHDSTAVMEITDFRCLGNQYLMYIGESYFPCAECGVVSKSTNANSGRKQKYCSECAAKVKVRQNVDSVMRRREVT